MELSQRAAGEVMEQFGGHITLYGRVLYHAVHDKYPAIANVDKLVDKYRRAGVDVT